VLLQASLQRQARRLSGYGSEVGVPRLCGVGERGGEGDPPILHASLDQARVENRPKKQTGIMALYVLYYIFWWKGKTIK
jgi:hypothetical protein